MWIAHYTDDTPDLSQYDDQGNERLFKEINLEKLEVFEIMLDSDGHPDFYGLCLDGGIFRINESYFHFEGFEGKKLKFIYFRRVKQSLGTDGDSGVETLHCVGFEADGKKRIMKISEETHEVTFEVK